MLDDSCMPTPLDLATLPRNVTTLRSLLLQREAGDAAALEQQAAELTAARNRLKEQVLHNEQLKTRLARLLRERFGTSSEKLRGAIEQLGLVLAELEEQVAGITPPISEELKVPTEDQPRRKPAASRCLRRCRAKWSNTPRRAHAQTAAARFAHSART